MVKKMFSLLLLLLTGLFMPHDLLSQSVNPCNNVTIEVLKTHLPNFPKNNIKILCKRPIKGFCEIILSYGNQNFPLYVGKDFVIVGNMYANQKNLTRESFEIVAQKEKERLAALFKKFKKDIDSIVVFTYSPAPKTKKTLYMFTDPLCPFSHRAEKRIKSIVKRHKATLKVVFYPIPIHLPLGEKLAIESICRNMSLDEYIKEKWRKQKPNKFQCKKGKEILKKSFEFGQKIEISGVPTFILSDGTRVVGVNFKEIEKMLQ